MISAKLTLTIMEGLFAVCKLEPDTPIPSWATQSPFFSITRTPEELSLVVAQEYVPGHIRSERPWHALKVEGPLDFALTGILVSLCAPLADTGVSVFVVSTYDTDYLLVREAQWENALEVLRRQHSIQP